MGRFASESAAQAYFHEAFDDDGRPCSSFAGDQGESFVDHDFMERAYHEAPLVDLARGLAGHSYSACYLPQVAAALGSTVVLPFNAVVLVWGKQIEQPVSVRSGAARLDYLGRFTCDPTARSVAGSPDQE